MAWTPADRQADGGVQKALDEIVYAVQELPLRPSSVSPMLLPSALVSPLSEGAVSSDPPLRASNDHRFIVGVPRAQRITGAAFRPSCSGSRGPHGFSPIFLSPSWGAAWLNPQLRASREHRFTVRPLRAKGVHQATPLSPLTALSPATYNSRYGLSCNALI